MTGVRVRIEILPKVKIGQCKATRMGKHTCMIYPNGYCAMHGGRVNVYNKTINIKSS